MTRSYTPSQIADGLLAGEFTRESAFVPLAEVERLTRDRAALWAEIERLREALRKSSCACSAITECVSAQDEDGNCPHFMARKELETKP